MARILLVSGDKTLRSRARDRFRTSRHRIRTARNLVSGVRLLQQDRYQIVCFDVPRSGRDSGSVPSPRRWLRGARWVQLSSKRARSPLNGNGTSRQLAMARRREILQKVEEALRRRSREGERGAGDRTRGSHSAALLQRRLCSERMRFSLALARLSAGIVLTDQKGEVSLINESAQRMLDVSSSNRGRVNPTPPLGRLLVKMRSCGSGQGKEGMVSLFRSGRAHLRGLVAPLRDRGGASWGSIAILEEEEGSRLDELKNDFISRVSHELKTPLASIRAASDVIAQARIGSLNKKQEKMLSIITQETANLVCLIEDLLDVAEIESGRVQLRFRRCTLSEIARTSLEKFRRRYREKGVALLDSLAQAYPPIHADPARIRQVFDNLLSNALKFTPPQGRVEVRVRLQSGAGKDSRRQMLLASVSDTGIGLGEADRERIFDKFQQVENLNTRTAGGTGQGLSKNQILVESHGGELWVRSRPGEGSTFFFTLPAAR